MIKGLRIFFRLRKRKLYKKANSLSSRRSSSKNKNYLKYKEQARVLVKERLDYYNNFYNYKWGKVAIRNQKTRWGSCSKRGNLNFNYKIVLLSSKQADYIIVHEICHLQEFNHSQVFWDLVSKTVPDYKEVRHSLHMNSLRLG